MESEEHLVEAAQNGHLDSFGALYERYYSGIVALAYSVLGDRHLSQDAAQQSFAIACRDLPKLKSKDKFGPWLAGICRNTAKQMKRSQNRLGAMNQFEAQEQQQEQDKHSNAVRQALWNLRAAEREPIVLRYYNGFSYEQISAVLGISTQAVHGRLTRAKRKIEKILKRNGFPGGDYENA